MRKKHLTYMLMTAAFASMLMFSGCNKKPAETTAAATETEKTSEEETLAEVAPELVYDLKKDTMQAESSGDGIVKAGSQLFLNYGDSIWQYNSNDGSLEKLFDNSGIEAKLYWVHAGSVYFIRQEQDKRTLWRYNLESGEEKQEAEISIIPFSLFVDNRQVFIKGYESNQVFRLNDQGDTEGELPVGECIIGLIPSNLSELITVNTAYAASHFKYLPLTDGNNLVITDITGENPRVVKDIVNTSAVLYAEKSFFYPVNDGMGNIEVYKYDADTLEKICVLKSDKNIELVQAKNGYLYYRESKTSGGIVNEFDYYCVSDGREYEEGSEQLISSVKNEAGMSLVMEKGIDFFVAEDGIYTEQFKDYSVYFAKYTFGKSDEPEIIEPELIGSYLSGIGHVEAKQHSSLNQFGNEYASWYIEQLILDEKDNAEGIKKINETLAETSKRYQENAESAIADIPEELIEMNSDGYASRAYSFSYTYKDIRFMDSSTICIEMDGYEYSGGVHGMPLRDYFVFDLKTGEQLGLADIIENPEDQLQKIVGAKFREKEEKANFAFESAEELEHTVSEMIDYRADFYLTEDGIVFYFPPYLIAPYSEGFPEVTVPYEELKMKREM